MEQPDRGELTHQLQEAECRIRLLEQTLTAQAPLVQLALATIGSHPELLNRLSNMRTYCATFLTEESQDPKSRGLVEYLNRQAGEMLLLLACTRKIRPGEIPPIRLVIRMDVTQLLQEIVNTASTWFAARKSTLRITGTVAGLVATSPLHLRLAFLYILSACAENIAQPTAITVHVHHDGDTIRITIENPCCVVPNGGGTPRMCNSNEVARCLLTAIHGTVHFEPCGQTGTVCQISLPYQPGG